MRGRTGGFDDQIIIDFGMKRILSRAAIEGTATSIETRISVTRLEPNDKIALSSVFALAFCFFFLLFPSRESTRRLPGTRRVGVKSRRDIFSRV